MTAFIFIGGLIVGFFFGCAVMAHASSIFGDDDDHRFS
jgi:hypothetical protein